MRFIRSINRLTSIFLPTARPVSAAHSATFSKIHTRARTTMMYKTISLALAAVLALGPSVHAGTTGGSSKKRKVS